MGFGGNVMTENMDEFNKYKEDVIIEIMDELEPTNINVLLGKLIFVTKASENGDAIYLTVKLAFDSEKVTDEAAEELNLMIDTVVGVII